MKLLRLDEDEIIQSDTYSSVFYINIDRVTHLEEVLYKQPLNGKRHEDVWNVGLGDPHQSTLPVTKAGFERIKQEMMESQ